MATVRLIFANLPPAWFVAPESQMSTVVDAGEQQFLSAQSTITAVAQSRKITTATGSDLDNLAALVGITRFVGETDDTFRQRVQATTGSRNSPSSLAVLQSTISAVLGAAVLVTNVPGYPGNFTVVVLGYGSTASATNVKTLIDSIRAGGTSYTVYISSPSAQSTAPLVGRFKVGTRRAGGFSQVTRIL